MFGDLTEGPTCAHIEEIIAGDPRVVRFIIDLAGGEVERGYIKSNEGHRLEQIAKGMGTSTKELKLPVQKLFAAKAIKTKGQKRGTKYFAR